MTDRELLDQISRDRSEAAFTELVRRHIDLVHSAGLRQLGDAEAARNLTQQVFLELARQAGRLHAAVILSGWLYRTTRHLCLETLRRDRRRREREHTAAAQLMNDATANPWEQVAPALEPAMDELGETDRQAILLRYFENKSLREVGTALGLGEDAAQKRVSRALDRLRDIFSRRGVSLSATALAGSLSAGAVQAAPAGLAVTISTAALGGAAVAAATTLATEGASTAMNLINLKTAAAILGAAAVTGTTTYLVQERETEQLRTEHTALNQTHAKLASDQQEALAMIQLRDEQIELLKRDVGDLPRLRGEVDRLNRNLEIVSRNKEQPSFSQEGTGISSSKSGRPGLVEDREKESINIRLQAFFQSVIAGNTNAILQDLAVIPMEKLSHDFTEQMKEAFVQQIVQDSANLENHVIQDIRFESSNVVRLAVAFIDRDQTSRIRDMAFVRAGEGWHPALFVGQHGVTFLSPHGVGTAKWESITIPRSRDPIGAK